MNFNMKKNNKKHSIAKAKRSIKNKKRLSKKPKLSKFERQQKRILEDLRFSIPLTLAKVRGTRDANEQSTS